MYLTVFVCFTSKAVHLELVSDFSTDVFLISFKRRMVTMLAEVEAVFKSRPIAPLSPDPNEALTTAHLILSEGLRSLLRESVDDIRGTERKLCKRWRLLCNLK